MSQSALEQLFAQFMAGIYGAESNASQFISDKPKLTANECLAIYRGSVKGNLMQALGDIYPASKSCVGDTFFDAMAARYVDAYPSRSSGLDDYGERFPEFMHCFPPLKELPYMHDLGLLEWHWHKAFHAKDESPLDLAALQSMAPAQQMDLVFQLNQSLTLIKSSYPLKLIWEMNRGFSDPDSIELDTGGGHFLVWRQGYETKVDEISETEFAFLSLLEKGDTLGTIYTTLLSNDANNDELSSILVSLLSSGKLTDFRSNT